MKTTNLIAILTLLAALPVAAEETTLRYNEVGELRLNMVQEIFPGGRTEPLAGRDFTMAFDFLEAQEDGEQLVQMTSVKGSYNAHGMNQRLSTNHLAGQRMVFAIDGRSFEPLLAGPDIDLGAITDGGLLPYALLADLLPVLPKRPVSLGMTWETDRPVKSLVGWAWSGGDIRYRHEITGIDSGDGRNVVHIRSIGDASLRSAAGHKGFTGEGTLQRRIDWTFDAYEGKLLSLSLQQETKGANQLPQGQVIVRQVTRIELQG